MKATLLALLTLGSLTMAAEQALTLSTDFSKGSSTGGDGYSGIAFRLTPDTDRYIGSNLLIEDATYELTSITIQWRNDKASTKIGDGVHLVVTDASDLEVLGISNNVSEWDEMTIGETTLINVATNTFEKSLSLSLDTSYYAFYVAHADIENVVLGQELSTQYLASVNLMAQGSSSTQVYKGAAQDFTLTKSDKLDSTNFTPRGSLAIVKNSNVPEPTTGTLSLLALAGLCIRRRK